ncbi:hypothetical protein ADL26_18160, partial [Thermoactinomyces vulgaris]
PLPPAHEEDGREGAHGDRGLGWSEDAEGAADYARIDQAAGARGTAHGARVRGFGAEGERGEQVGADVERQDLQDPDREWQGAAEEGPHGERRQLGDVVGEVVGQEAADVREG